MFETFQTIINVGGYDLVGFTERRITPSPTVPTPHWPTV